MEYELACCPFCGKRPSIGIMDDDGNDRTNDQRYIEKHKEELSYFIKHHIDSAPNCPIAMDDGYCGGMVGIHAYESVEEAVKAWNGGIL